MPGHAPWAQSSTAMVQKQRRRGLRILDPLQLVAAVQISIQGSARLAVNWAESLLRILPEHPEQASFAIPIFKAKRTELADAQPSPVEDLQDRAIPEIPGGARSRRVHHRERFVHRKELGQGLRKLGAFHVSRRIDDNPALAREEAVQRLDARKLSRSRRGCQLRRP